MSFTNNNLSTIKQSLVVFNVNFFSDVFLERTQGTKISREFSEEETCRTQTTLCACAEILR